MSHDEWADRTASAMSSLKNEFGENELAYLALTSKIERQVIDRLAFCLQRDYGKREDVFVAREYTRRKAKNPDDNVSRVDLAIVVGDEPQLFLEAKAMTQNGICKERPRSIFRNSIC